MYPTRTQCVTRVTLALAAALACGGLGRVSLAQDLIVSSGFPTVFFDTTSTVNGGFPEWKIVADSSLGFSIINADGQTVTRPFHIEVGAPEASISVNSVGNVGVGTRTPAQKLHLVTDTNPTIRLEQTGSLTNPARTWDLIANEVNFFIQDVTAASPPFLIAAGAPPFGLVLQANGWLGLGTLSPEGNLHISGPANQDVFNGIGPDLNTGPAFNFGYSGASFGAGTGFFNVRGATSGVNPSLRFATVNQQRLIITNAGRVGIGTLNPSQALEVNGNIRANGSFLANGTTLTVPDYVFEPDYKLRLLTALAAYVEKEKHLPDLPSTQEIKAQGVNLSELQMQLLKKVEELTLYTVAQDKTNKAQEKIIAVQGATIAALTRARLEEGKIIGGSAVRLSAVEQVQKR